MARTKKRVQIEATEEWVMKKLGFSGEMRAVDYDVARGIFRFHITGDDRFPDVPEGQEAPVVDYMWTDCIDG